MTQEKSISPATKEQFFALLRAGLWGTSADASLFCGRNDSSFANTTDWATIYCLAQQQTVVGIVYDGIATLPVELQPDKVLLMQWYSIVVRIEQSNELLNSTLAELNAIYLDAGLTPVLLKGQGVGQNYLNPMRRQCGDIDLFIGKADYSRATELLKSRGMLDDGFLESYKHLHYHYNGVAIENHPIITRLRNSESNRYFESIVEKWFPIGCRNIDINSSSILLPPTQFDAIFILIHASSHFFEGGCGLRQFCDWLRLLYTYKTEIDKEQLAKDIRKLKLERVWQTFGYLAVNKLGFPKEHMPLYSPKYAKQADKALEFILAEGNFGQHADRGARPKSYISGKLHSFRYNIRRLSRLYLIFPQKALIYALIFVKDGVKAVAKDKF